MNKLSLLLAASISVVAAGCHKSDNRVEKINQPSTFQTPSGPVELKVKWTPGEEVKQVIAMRMENQIAIPGRANPMAQEAEMGEDFDVKVLPNAADGGRVLEMEFQGVRMSSTLDGKTSVSFDSAQKSLDAKTDATVSVLTNLVGVKIKVFLNASNGVDHIEGADEMMQRISRGMSPAEAQTIGGMMSDDYFKQFMNYNQFLPPKAAQPGDTWPLDVVMNLPPIGKMTLHYDVTFKDWEMHGPRNCARLDFTGTIKTEADNSTTNVVKFNNFSGDTSGSSWFDPDLGISVDTSMNQDMDMTMSIAVRGSTQVISNKLNQAISVKVSSLK